MCDSRKYPYPPNMEDFLIYTAPPPGFSIPGGLWWPPLPPPPFPRNFQNFWTGTFNHSQKIQSGFGNLKKESEY